MKEANFETETLYHVIECRDLQEKESATTGDKKTMLQVIGGRYKDGFRFLESFELAKMHYGVFTKDVEVAMSTAPTTEPAKRPPLSEWPSYVLEINRLRLIEQQYTIGRVWNIAGYVMDWHGCDGELRITESINELFELVSAVQDVLTNAGIAIAITGQGLNHHVTRRAFVEQIAEIICEQAKGIGQDAATTVQEASDRFTKAFQDLNKNRPSDYEPLPTLHDFTEFVQDSWAQVAESENDKLKRLFHQVYEKYGVDISSAQSKHWSIFIDNAHKLLLRKVGTSRNINYGVIKELRDLENCIRQIHDSSLLRCKYMNDAQFRTHANKLTTEALAKIGPRDESKSALDHQPDNSQLAALPTMSDITVDYEELKSLREANKRQSRIIDDLLRDKANLIEKKNSLTESVMSLTDLNSEIAEKCKRLESEASDAKLTAKVAYSRGHGVVPNKGSDQDFEDWWNAFHYSKPNPKPKSMLDRVIDVACDYFGWKGNLDDAMRISDNNLDGFLDTVTRKLDMYGGNMATIDHYVDKGYTRKKFLREIAVELYEGKK